VEHQIREMEGAGQVIESLLVKKAECKKEVATQPMSRKEADEHLADMYAADAVSPLLCLPQRVTSHN
jgi:hypothetical protein